MTRLSDDISHCEISTYEAGYEGKIQLPSKKILQTLLHSNSVVYILHLSQDFAQKLSGILDLPVYILSKFMLPYRNSTNIKLYENSTLKHDEYFLMHDIFVVFNNRTHRCDIMFSSQSIFQDKNASKIVINSMNTLKHAKVDFLQISLYNYSFNILYNIFSLKIFPKILLISIKKIDIIVNDRIMSLVKSFGYVLYSNSGSYGHITLLLEGCKENTLFIDAKQLFLMHGFVNLQFLNSGYTEITKSWICNVKKLKGVIDKTLFLVSDRQAYEELIKFGNYNIVLIEFNSSKDLKYGSRNYFSYIYFRAKIISDLLHKNINLWLTESDAVWFDSPFTEMDETVEAILVDNNPSGKKKQVSGGMIYLKSTTKVIKVWDSLLNWLNKTKASQDEMPFLTQLFIKSKVKKRWLIYPQYVSGLWYTNKQLHSGKEKIIQNNYIKGNPAKIRQSQEIWTLVFKFFKQMSIISIVEIKFEMIFSVILCNKLKDIDLLC